MSDNSGQSSEGQGKRRALHQRSDSDTNAQSLAPTPKRLSDEPDFVVSNKNYSVSIWSSSNSSKNVSGRPSGHRRTQTDSSNNFSSGHSRSNTRSTIQSQKSLDSLPPVPPLRIQKDPVESSGSAAATAQPATTGYTGGERASEKQEHEVQQGASRPRSSLRLPALPAPVLSYHGLSNPESPEFNVTSLSFPANASFPLRLPPKSILKKASQESSNFADYEDNRSSLDPYSAVSETSSYRIRNPRTSTSYEYLRRSRAWAGAAGLTNDSSNGERMNAHTLRAVPASSDGASFTTEDSYTGDVVPVGLGVRGGTIRPVASSHERTDSQISSSSSKTEAVALPTWTSYFYGHATASGLPAFPTPREEPEEDSYPPVPMTIRAVDTSSVEATSTPRPHARISPDITEIPYCQSTSEIPSKTSSCRSMWSIPHLDHSQFSRLEAMSRNRQIILFCLGFIMPLCWFAAAFLPLPQGPGIRHSKDLESAIAQDVYTTMTTQDYLAKRWENSRFWRRVNRVLSGVGLCVIIAVVVVAAVSAAT